MLNPAAIYESLVKSGEAWADAHHAAELLEETKSTLLAKLMNESNLSSQAAKESWAKSQQEYISHIESMVRARRAANRSKVLYDSMKVLAELRRTEAANERAANRYA